MTKIFKINFFETQSLFGGVTLPQIKKKIQHNTKRDKTLNLEQMRWQIFSGERYSFNTKQKRSQVICFNKLGN